MFRATGLRRPLDLYLLGEAVASGFLEFVAPALEKLEASAPNNSLPPPYRCYLITTACVCGDIADPAIKASAPRTAEAVELLIGRWTDMGHWGYHYLKDDNEDYMVPCTSIMALCRFALSGGSPDIFCSALEKMLRHGTGGDLQDVTTFAIYKERPRPGPNTDDAGSDVDSDTDSDADIYAIRMHCFELDVVASARDQVVIEANMAYIIDIILKLYQRLMQERGLLAEKIHSLTIALTSWSTPKIAKVRLIRPNVFSDSGLGTSAAISISGADSSLLLERLTDFRVFPEGSEYLLSVPGMGRKIREIAARGRSSYWMELERPGHLVANEEVQNWPPKPY